MKKYRNVYIFLTLLMGFVGCCFVSWLLFTERTKVALEFITPDISSQDAYFIAGVVFTAFVVMAGAFLSDLLKPLSQKFFDKHSKNNPNGETIIK